MPTINPKYIFYSFALLIAVLVVWHFYDLEKNKIKSDFVTEQTKVVADEKAKDETAVNQLETKYETITRVEIQYVDRIVTKEVIKYRDRVVNRCDLDAEWVRIYNLSTEQAGAESAASEPNGASGTTPKAVDDAVALDVVTNNNRICIAEIAKLTALQEWAKLPIQEVKQ